MFKGKTHHPLHINVFLYLVFSSSLAKGYDSGPPSLQGGPESQGEPES
jgi:hypothetical protein